MRKSVLNVLAFAAALLAAPLAAAQTISAPLQLRTGDAFTLELEYSQAAEIGEQQLTARMTQVYAVHVLDAENRLWRFLPVSMSYEMPQVPGIEPEAVPINWLAMSDALSAMMRIATDVGFECRVNEYGRCVDMTNWPFWSARVENFVLMVDGIARAMPPRAPTQPPPIAVEPQAPGQAKAEGDTTTEPGLAATPTPAPPGPDWQTLRGPVLQGVARLIDGFDSRDAAAGMSWVNIPAFVQGRTLTRRQNVAFTDEYDMPFGAPPLRYTGTLRLERIDRNANTALVVRRATLDQASARESLRAMTEFVSEALVEPLAPHFPEGQQPPDGTALAQLLDTMLADLAYEETTRGVIDLTTGMARETTTDFTISARMAGTEEPVETRGQIITRVRPAAPDVPRLPRS